MVVRFKLLLWGGMFLLVMVGCAPAIQAEPTSGAPRLLSEVTLEPPTVTPLRFATLTDTPTITTNKTLIVNNPVGVQGDFEFVTVTPPPSITPIPSSTLTPTLTLSPTRTFTPSITPSLTLTPSPTRTTTISPSLTLIVPQASPFGGTACSYTWFFVPMPANCPSGESESALAVAQQMEGGVMINLQSKQIIYVLYTTGNWTFAFDTYIAGQFPEDANFFPPPGRIQPVRSLGKLWRNNPQLQDILGWGIAPEVTYTALTQVDAVTGMRYITGSNGEIFVLQADQTWYRER